MQTYASQNFKERNWLCFTKPSGSTSEHILKDELKE
jgi:hypothetical protein